MSLTDKDDLELFLEVDRALFARDQVLYDRMQSRDEYVRASLWEQRLMMREHYVQDSLYTALGSLYAMCYSILEKQGWSGMGIYSNTLRIT